MKPKKLTPEQIQNTLTNAVKDAVSFIESEIAPQRITAQKYFDGKTRLASEDGRSKVVATKCRDTVRAIKPALMRLFLQSDKPVEFIPSSEQSVQGAEQATKYAKYVFDSNEGFHILHGAIHDALVKKVGIVKAYYEETPEVEIDEYTALPLEAITLMGEDPDIEILEQEPDEYGTFEVTVSRKSKRGKICLSSVAPEDFFVDRAATKIHDCYVCGHSRNGRVGDLVEMGFDFEEVYNLGGTGRSITGDEEDLERKGFDNDTDGESPNDPSMRSVMITEAYMKMDIEGSGVPKKYKFICAGDDYKILDREPCDHNPFAVFEVDPEPHTFFGRSLVDIIIDDQDAATSMLRGLLDSISMANNPRTWAVENQVNADDLLNNEIGGIIRVKAPGMMGEFAIGSAATMALPAIQFYDEVIRAKTGVVGAGMGLDVDALQSQTAAGVRLAEQTTAAVAELIARVLAEGGMRQLFGIIAELARQHPDQETMMRIDGQFIPVDPSSWGTRMELQVNVGLGTGKHEERIMVLQQTLQTQQMIWQAFGPSNGLVTMTGIRATLVDIMRLGGVYNGDRYYNPMNPQIEADLMAKAAEAAAGQQQATDPNAAYIQVEEMKSENRMKEAEQKAQLDGQKAQTDAQLRVSEMMRQDDLDRDRMLQDLAIKVAELLQKGVQVNTQQLRAEQEAPRV